MVLKTTKQKIHKQPKKYRYIKIEENDFKLLIETLYNDSESTVFNEQLRKDVKKALANLSVFEEEDVLFINETIIPNWFKKSHVEELTNKKITTKDFKEFKEYLDGCVGFAASISEDIEVLYDSFLEDKKNRKKNKKILESVKMIVDNLPLHLYKKKEELEKDAVLTEIKKQLKLSDKKYDIITDYAWALYENRKKAAKKIVAG